MNATLLTTHCREVTPSLHPNWLSRQFSRQSVASRCCLIAAIPTESQHFCRDSDAARHSKGRSRQKSRHFGGMTQRPIP